MAVNVELLEKVKEQITNEADSFDMYDFYQNEEEIFDYGGKVPMCGSICCIGGWALNLQGTRMCDVVDFHKEAKSVLGVTEEQANSLFYTSDWPKDIKLKLFAYDPFTPEYAKVACDRIDHFIATGE